MPPKNRNAFRKKLKPKGSCLLSFAFSVRIPHIAAARAQNGPLAHKQLNANLFHCGSAALADMLFIIGIHSVITLTSSFAQVQFGASEGKQTSGNMSRNQGSINA